jgi:response regulator RpfG family c-di-GMP phosphodiesterase
MIDTTKINILYVDDEINNLTAFKASFRKVYQIFTANSAGDGLKILKENKIHVIITDQRMPGKTGIEFLEEVIVFYPDPIRILLTGYSDIQVVIDAINKGQIYRYLMKPFNELEVKLNVETAYELFSLREQNKELIEKLRITNEQLEFMLRQQMSS